VTVTSLLNTLAESRPLTESEAVALFDAIMSGEATPAQIGAALAMIQMRGPSVDEIVGAAAVMRDKAARVTPPDGLIVIDTCGTGGDGAQTFNISTGAAIVAAAAGRPHGLCVAKHGNRSVTSRSGSSDVLHSLGVALRVTPETLTRALLEAGICFCFAPAHHPAMKHAAPVRKDLGMRTIFNMLGPLTNPAGASRQVIGVFNPTVGEHLGAALLRLGSRHAMVVHGQFGSGGLDEISTAGSTHIIELLEGEIRSATLAPADLGVTPADPESLRSDGAEHSAATLRSIFAGESGPARDIVAVNAAAALVVGGVARDLDGGRAMAEAAIDDGSAKRSLAALAAITQEGALDG